MKWKEFIKRHWADDEPEHVHVFDSAVYYTERPQSLSCICGAALIRDPRTELWEVH